MKRTMRTLALGMAITLTASLFTACGQSAKAPADTNASATANGSAAAATDKPYTFHFISHKLPDDKTGYGYAINEVMKEYTAKHPNFTFDYEVVEQMSVPGKISLLIASNDVPDAFTSEAGAAMKQIIDSGSIVNMDEALKKLGFESYESVVNDAAISFIQGINGKPYYYLPTNQTAEGIWYNKDMFKKYNLEVPKTWDEFLKVCDTLKKNGVQPLSAGGQTKWPLTRWLAVTSAHLLGPDSIRKASQEDGLTFKDPKFIQAAKLTQDLFKAGYFGEGFNSYDSGTGAKMYIQGKVAMTYYLTSTMINLIDDSQSNLIGKDAVGVFPVPSIAGGIPQAESDSMNCLGINQALAFSKDKFQKGTNNDFLKYFVDNFGKKLWSLNMMSPYRQNVPDTLTDGQKVAKGLLDSVKTSHLWWEGAMNTAVTNLADENAQLLVEGSMTPEDYMNKLAEAVASKK